MISWTRSDSIAATAEGWDVFECIGSDNGPWQLQRDDELEVFEDDPAAWVHVWDKAMRESPLHV